LSKEANNYEAKALKIAVSAVNVWHLGFPRIVKEQREIEERPQFNESR
jgi:hypothetical protein